MDEVIDRLEWAYDHRGALQNIGETAGNSMAEYSWRAAARQFYELTDKARNGEETTPGGLKSPEPEITAPSTEP